MPVFLLAHCYFLSCYFFPTATLIESTELHVSLIFLIPVFLLAHCYFLSCYFFSYLPTVSFSLLLLSYCYPDWINGTTCITYFPNTCILTCPLLLSFLLLFFLLVHCYFLSCYFFSCYFFSYLKLLLSFLLPFFPVTFFPCTVSWT